MICFLPYPDFAKSAKVLDNKRLGKQRLEAKQILEINLIVQNPYEYQVCSNCNTIYERDYNILEHNRDCFLSGCVFDLVAYRRIVKKDLKLAWENHPAVLMWRGYELALAEYGIAICREWISRGFRDNQLDFFEDNCLENDEDYEIKYPDWLGNPKLHSSHRASLLFKNYEWYKKFNWVEEPKIKYVWPK